MAFEDIDGERALKIGVSLNVQVSALLHALLVTLLLLKCSDTGFGESLYLLINAYVFIFLTSESIAPCAWAGVGLVVSPVERVKGQT